MSKILIGISTDLSENPIRINTQYALFIVLAETLRKEVSKASHPCETLFSTWHMSGHIEKCGSEHILLPFHFKTNSLC